MVNFMIDRACCENGSDDPRESQDCLDKWKKQLEDACNKYTKLISITNSYHEAYKNSYSWENKLKRWIDLVENTDEKAGNVVDTLQFIVEQINTVCANSSGTVEALQKITCLIKVFFNAFFTFNDNQKGLKDKITDFKTEVECSSASNEDKEEVIKCIELYEAKIKLVCELQVAILGKLIETLKCAIKLDTFFCDENSGLKVKILKIIDDFEHGLPEDDKCGMGHDKNNEEVPDTTQFPCNPNKVKPKPIIRIGNDNEYYSELKDAYDKAVEETKSLQEEWRVSKIESDTKYSEKTSLKEAIRAAEVAEKGK